MRSTNLVSGRLLARNTLLNFLGQAMPMLVGVVTIPFIVRGLGTERFGLLSLAWVVLGYFAVFDLGLGRATTKFVAEALGKGEEEDIPRLVWTAVTVQAMFGALAGLVLTGITPLLVERVLNIPPELIGEARTTFYLLALSVPVVLISGSFGGVLEASQRFDLVNAVKIPASSFTYLLPLVGLLLGFRLPGIVALILASRLVTLSALVALAFHVFPNAKKFSTSFTYFPRLFIYGSWLTISNMITPFLRYLNHFIIGTLLSMSAVAYYSVPFSITERVWIIPVSLTLTLFPAFSALSGTGHYKRTQDLLVRSVKYLIILIIPFVFLIAVFAKLILQIWLGEDFAQNSTLVFQLLAIGTAITIPAFIPMSIIQAYGHPDFIAKLYLMLIPVNVFLDFVLVKNMGVPGAGLSYILKALIDTSLLFMIASRIIRISLTLFLRNVSQAIAITCLAGFLFGATMWVSNFLVIQVVFICSIIALFALVAWHWILNDEDRIMLRSLLRRSDRWIT
jgi:O-antigen/teichoic acid export membrane protein